MNTEFPKRVGDTCQLLVDILADNHVPWADAGAATMMLAAYLCCHHPAGNDRVVTRDWFVKLLDLALAQSPVESTDNLPKVH